MTEITYNVPDMTCGHCKQAISSGLARVAGVASVDVDLATKRVVVRGDGLDDVALRVAIADAGYEAT